MFHTISAPPKSLFGVVTDDDEASLAILEFDRVQGKIVWTFRPEREE